MYFSGFINFPKILVNKRLDEWVSKDRLDLTKVQLPKKEVKTPLKEIKNGSRPCSPDREIVVSTCSVIVLHIFFIYLFFNKTFQNANSYIH